MNKELIERMKNNTKIYAMLSTEETECLQEVGLVNCSYYNPDTYRWASSKQIIEMEFVRSVVYKIKPAFKPIKDILNSGAVYLILNKGECGEIVAEYFIGRYIGIKQGGYEFLKTNKDRFIVYPNEWDFEKVLTHKNPISTNLVAEDDA